MPANIPGSRDDFSGDVSLTAPTGGVVAGLIYKFSSSYLVARETKDAGAAALHAFDGYAWATKVTGTGKSFVVGEEAHWLVGTKKVQKSATGSTIAGIVARAAGASDTTVLIKLIGLAPTES